MEYVMGLAPKAVRSFSERFKLRFAGKHGRHAQGYLAAQIYDMLENEGYTREEVLPIYHILPVEACLYYHGMKAFLASKGWDYKDMLSNFSWPDIAFTWIEEGHAVGLPKAVLYDIGGGDNELAGQIHRRYGTEPSAKLRRAKRSEAPSP